MVASFGDRITMNLKIGSEQTFEVTAVPQRIAQQKTIRRLMRLQPEIQKGLALLSARRRRQDNRTYTRAGRPWTDRATMTKLTKMAAGERFTIHVTPQIVPDIRSVERFLTVK